MVDAAPMLIMPPRLCVICDTREKAPWQFSASADVEVATLHVGDYSVRGFETRWAIERKSLADYVGSVTTGRDRFLRELSLLRRYEQACIIVEATIDDVLERRYQKRSRRGEMVGSIVHPNSVLGTTHALRSRYVPVYFEGPPSHAALSAEGLLWRWLRDEQAMKAKGTP